MSARKCPHGTQITTQSKQNLNFTLQLPASRNKPLRSLTNINTQYRKINTGGLISLIGNISQQLYIHTYDSHVVIRRNNISSTPSTHEPVYSTCFNVLLNLEANCQGLSTYLPQKMDSKSTQM